MPADGETDLKETVTEQVLLERASNWYDELSSRADEIEQGRKLPQDIADRLAADGFYAMCNPPEWGGADCSQQQCLRNCSGHGACLDGKCWCKPGFGGLDCSLRTCPGDCGGNGWCNDGACLCYPEYGGADCNVHSGNRRIPMKCALSCVHGCLGKCSHMYTHAHTPAMQPATTNRTRAHQTISSFEESR